VLTGLRKAELGSLTVGLRDDLAQDLAEWLASKLERVQSEARHLGEPIPARLQSP
jgi:hypothetical protein